MMLKQVLQYFEEKNGAVSLNQMARDLKLEPGMLDGMLDYWVRKGKIRVTDAMCSTCGVEASCPFVMRMPRHYELVRQDEPEASTPMCQCGKCH